MIKAALGDSVKVRYEGRLADGTVFDASTEDRPLHFILGRKEVIPGFEEAVVGMFQGETRTVIIPPEKAYGVHDPGLVEEIDRSTLPAGLNLRVGRQLEITGQRGDKLLVLIAGLTEDVVTLDGNHPLAGKKLVFDIEVLQVEKRAPH